jgi:hypothetical protein
MDTKVRCKNGERKDPKTGECIKLSDAVLKHKQALRNKKKGIIVDDTGNKVKPSRYGRVYPTDVLIEPTDVLIEPTDVLIEPTDVLIEPTDNKTKKKTRCKNGERKNIKTGECDKINKVEPLPRGSEPGIDLSEELINTSIREPEKILKQYTIKSNIFKKNQENDDEVEENDDEVEENDDEVEKNDDEVEKNDDEVEENDYGVEENDDGAEEEKENDEDKSLYPSLDDPNFSYKIANRQEFSDTKYDGYIKDIREQAIKLCNAPFELLPHQLFVRNFLSFQTPYNSLLLYHGLGSGKTCSAIGIAEEMRSYMKQMGITKRIIIVASPNVQDNFRLQLFDERRLEQFPDGTWNLNTCIGNTLLQEINPTNLQGFTKERIITQIRSLINQYYVFMGNKGEFANYIKKSITIPKDAGYSEKEMTTLREKKIKLHFNNRLVILDEIHNIRISDANKTKLTSVLLNEIARKSDNMRLLLLSATPMYNSYNEIVWLTNLLNANDNRSSIKIEDVFKPDGSWIQPSETNEGGLEILKRKLSGYISYVRGENPYVFPYRIYPNTFSPENTITTYPTKQMNQMNITEPLKFIPVYKNGIGSYQSKGYEYILQDLGLRSSKVVDKNGRERIMPSFENMEQFGYTLLLVPLESLIMVYPNIKFDKMLKSNIELDEKESKDVISSMIGKQGLSNAMKFSKVEKPIPKRFDYEYKTSFQQSYGRIFDPEEIGKYSSKISNICNIIKRPSKGIILIYSQYIDGGLIPMALALESMGLTRYSSTKEHSYNLMKKGTSGELIDSITMKKRSETTEFKPARYVLITGEKYFSQNNNEDLKYVTNSSNSQGENVKVILISMAASEGLDFKNIRQIHILEPWYNMNRVEQIIGRGVRNFSHCSLDFEDRNVEIYLHGTILDKDEESADMYVYRNAEKKAIQIGQVTRVLKEMSVDCLLNISQTNFTEAKLLEDIANRDIRIRLSSGGDKLIPFKIGDKPRTDACDYMDNCEYKCNIDNNLPDIINPIRDTYDENFIKTNSIVIMKKIRDLFRERVIYRRDHLIAAINQLKKYPIEHIYYALTRFVQNKHEVLIDKYGRSGYLISRNDYYAFQPSEIMDESISIYERSVPVDYKPVSLKMQLPNTIKGWPDYIDRTDAIEVITQPTQNNEKKTYEDIINKINEIVNTLSNKNIKIKANQNDWYKHASKTVDELLLTHKMNIEWIVKFIVFHYLDRLPLDDKLTLVSKIYDNPNTIGYDVIIKDYFDGLLLTTSDNENGIILADGSVNKLFVKDPDWKPSTYTDEQLFAELKKDRFNIPYKEINSTQIGFMHPFKDKDILFKDKDMVFKTKDLKQTRNNVGAKCTDASKQDIAKKIGILLDEPSLYTATRIEKPQLCIIYEILLRWKTEATNVTYFFRPEFVNEMKITTLHW